MSAVVPMQSVMLLARTARRTSLTAKVRQQIVDRAGAFIRQRYRMDQAQAQLLLDVPVKWRRGKGRSAFYPRPCRGFAGPHILLRVPPGAFARWHTYRRVRARWSTPAGGVELPVDVLMTVVLIHEYTHAVQHGICGHAKQRFSEVETTENELEFVRLYAPHAHAQLVHVSGGVQRRTGGRRGPLHLLVEPKHTRRPTPARPTGAHALALRLLRGIMVRYQLARGG